MTIDHASLTGGQGRCLWCNEHHPEIVCPLILAVEWYPDGKIRRLEFHNMEELRLDPVLLDDEPTPPANAN